MKNIEMKHDPKTGKLTITIDTKQRFGLSKSAESIIIASTEGNVAMPGDDDDAKIVITAYSKQQPALGEARVKAGLPREIVKERRPR